ncbi:MAG: homoserine O-acetyltransferase [Gammaproteobacteria bacterium]|jgi:homoserine O-acetyltransferase
MADEENAYSFTTKATHLKTLTQLPAEGFPLWRGGHLSEVTLAYESWGELSLEADNAILIFTGLSPSAHAASSERDSSPGWWEYLIGPGKAIDTDRFFVVCANTLGGCYGSTGPGSKNPATGKQYGIDFPDLCLEDVASSGRYLMRELGVEKLHAVIGSSMGGMSSMAFAMQFPDEVNFLVVISAAVRALPLSIAIRSLQREIIRSDEAWNKGDYQSPPVNGMKMARKFGLVSYRSVDEWNSKFDRSRIDEDKRGKEPFGIEYDIENYLEYNALKFATSFDANSYQYLSRAMDWFDLAEHGSSLEDAMARIKVKKALVIGVTTDTLFPVRQQQEIAELMKLTGTNVVFSEIDSVNGHDAFLIDDEHFTPVVKDFLDQSSLNN